MRLEPVDWPKLYMVRAGEDAVLASEFRSLGVVAIGWLKDLDLSEVERTDVLRDALREAYPDRTSQQIADDERQVATFLFQLAPGVHVLTYDRDNREYSLGVVSGDYEYRPDLAFETRTGLYPHVFPVRWLRTIRRDELDAATKTALNDRHTIWKVGPPEVARQLLEDQAGAGVSEPATVHPQLNLLFKWSRDREPRTIELHREVVERRGAVWWGNSASSLRRNPLSDEAIRLLSTQIAEGVRTFAFLYGGGQLWRARMMKITRNPRDVDDERVPSYYGGKIGNLFALLTDFEQMEPDWAGSHLLLQSHPSDFERMRGALSNQTTPLRVLVVEQPTAHHAVSVWWVNQGINYRIEHDGGYIFAPHTDRRGHPRYYYTNISSLAPGDLILHNSGGAIRAVGEVTRETVDAPRPGTAEPIGFLGSVAYRDLARPFLLADIPESLRLPTPHGPFATDGRPKDGYLFELPENVAAGILDLIGAEGDLPPQLDLAQEELPIVSAGADVSDLTFDDLQEAIAESGLSIPEELLLAVLAALRSGKHLLLIGAPGTGKTTLAQAIGEAAKRAGIAEGWTVTTATADWTSAETVGGYWMTDEQKLRFRPGQVLQAIESNRWLAIDELNRADIDKAFGQLFTVLSGQGVVLPFDEEREGIKRPVAILPQGIGMPDVHAYIVRRTWRLLATLNTRDRDLLFNMSFALQRRFAIVELPNPAPERYRQLLADKAGTGSTMLDAALATFIELPHASIGPAILLDAGAYLHARLSLDTELGNPPKERAYLLDALNAFVLPQLVDLSRAQMTDVVKFITAKTLGSNDYPPVARLLGAAFGVDPADITPASNEESQDVGVDLEP